MKTTELLQWLTENNVSFEYFKGLGKIEVGKTFTVFTYGDVIHIHKNTLGVKKDFKTLNKLVEYIETPVNDRQEIKRYRLKLPVTSNIKRYLRVSWNNVNNFEFARAKSTDYFQVEFTQEELDKLPYQELIKSLIKEKINEI